MQSVYENKEWLKYLKGKKYLEFKVLLLNIMHSHSCTMKYKEKACVSFPDFQKYLNDVHHTRGELKFND